MIYVFDIVEILVSPQSRFLLIYLYVHSPAAVAARGLLSPGRA